MSTERYADKIPEVLRAPINKLGAKLTVRLDRLEPRVQDYIVNLVLHKIASFFSGLGGHISESSEMGPDICTWRSALCDLSVMQILSGLYLVLTGATEYQKFPPSSPIAFYCLCKHNARSLWDRAHYEAEIRETPHIVEERKSSSQDVGKKWLQEIWKTTRLTKPKYLDGG